MFDKDHQLDVTAQDLAVIEAALHTQSKILSVQASAGGTVARAKLNSVKQVLAQIEAQKPAPKRSCRSRGFFGFGMKRIFG